MSWSWNPQKAAKRWWREENLRMGRDPNWRPPRPARMKRRLLLVLYDGVPCPYCGCTMQIEDEARRPTRDHMLPRSRGGTDALSNICICCNECNQTKADMTRDEYVASRALAQPTDDRTDDSTSSTSA